MRSCARINSSERREIAAADDEQEYGQLMVLRVVTAPARLESIFYRFDLPMPTELALNPGPLQHGAQRDVLLHLGVAWTRP